MTRVVRQLFGRLDAGDYDALVARADDHITHTFAGQSALGGTRRGTAALRAWFERVGRLFPDLRFDVRDIAVSGWPWHTTATVRWRDHGHRADGEPYENHGVHVVVIRWGRATSIDAYLDTAHLDQALAEMSANGINEASADPITDADANAGTPTLDGSPR